MFNLYTLYVVDTDRMTAQPLFTTRRMYRIIEEAKEIKLGKGKRLVMTTNGDAEGLLDDYEIIYE